MNIFSTRSYLLIAIVALLAANILWRLPGLIFQNKQFDLKHEEIWSAPNILPTVTNLATMGAQWKARLATLPPEERKRSQQRLQEETQFFISLRSLPAPERARQARARLESLMNDPEIQAEWLGDRMSILAGLDPKTRNNVIRDYVQNKQRNSNDPQ